MIVRISGEGQYRLGDEQAGRLNELENQVVEVVEGGREDGFAQAFASTGSRDLFTRKDRQGHSWAAHSNSRGKSDEGQLHSHEDWTGVVVIMSGAATFITPGSPSTVRGARETAEGGSLIGPGESHRVSKGDVVIIPPNAPHMYRNIEEPFRYLVVQTP